MPAYWVARAKVNDPVEYKKYADRVPAILAKYGAKVLTRGGRYQILEARRDSTASSSSSSRPSSRASPASIRRSTGRRRRFAAGTGREKTSS